MNTVFQLLKPSMSAPKLVVALAFGAMLTSQIASAQVGNDNPTGLAGQFNGNITTGCSYDPYTGNAMRAVTDIVVAGTVGKYPLAFSRVSNSRFAGASGFGISGAWRHSYAWELNATEETTQHNFQPTQYPVAFPDGREVTFVHSFSDTYFRAPAPGIRERFIPLNLSTMLAYLVLPDGGKIRFKATQYSWTEEWGGDGPPATPPPELTSNRKESNIRRVSLRPPPEPPGGTRTWWGYTYQAEAIIDPYGQETTLTYSPDGYLTRIQEPAINPTDPGRKSIDIHYVLSNYETVIDYVQASDGRIVRYNYSATPIGAATRGWTHLDSVVYYPDPTAPSPPTALYTYQTPNVNSVDGAPLLSTAYDPMYGGPMKGISYEYATGMNGDTTAVANGQIRSERSIDGVLVSNLAVINQGRRETKGEGGARDMHLDPPHVVAWTDYVNNSNFASQHFDSITGYRDYAIDLNHNTTTFTSDPLTGNITSVTFPQTPGDTPPGTPAGSVALRYLATCSEDPNNCDAANPYYLYSSTDEAGNTTVYLRDEHHRIRQINYPDYAHEEFQYNALGQMTYHRLKTGGWESFEFDPNTHLLQAYRDPYHDPLGHSGKPTNGLAYNARGLVSAVTDWRGGYTGDPNYTTEYEYNLRGQVTLVRHPIDLAHYPLRYTVQTAYNTDGTLASATDERGHVTSYNYDNYKRLWWTAAPPADENDTLPRTTYFHYNRDGTNTLDYTHTDSLVSNLQTPSGKTVRTFYNYNRQKTAEIAGTGDESAYTSYTYDNAGNLKTVKDPAGQSTGLYTESFYDERNRPFAVNDPISADRNSAGYTVNWTYDAGGRRKTETRANNQVVTNDEFDQMNRLLQKSVQRDAGIVDTTLTRYDFDGSISTFQDGRGHSYYYGHDLMSRQTYILYPSDDTGAMRQESYHYDLANNMDTFTDREGAVQTFDYDNRNRQTHYLWNSWPLYTMHERWMSYDEAGNVRNIHNGETAANSGDSIDRQYDWRNRLKSETQTPTSRTPRTVAYTYDPDSNRKTMTYPSGYSLTYDYSSRNQLITQSDAAGVLATYSYDLSGNRRTRTLGNGTVTSYTPDPMNRTKDVGHYRGGTLLGRFDYRYDTVGRIKSAKRDFSKGDYYEYYLDDQLKTAQYDAYNVDLDAPWGAANVTTLSYDANGNRTSQVNTATPSNTYGVNDLNQYNAVNSATPDYDVSGNLSHFDGWTYGYNRQNQLTDAVSGSTALYFYHDGLNRHILRYIGDANGGEWIFSAWDGWDLLEEYDINGQVIHSYVHGPGSDEMVMRFDPGVNASRIWYYRDAQGSTSHLADDSGHVVESYKYPAAASGAPLIYTASGQQISNSAYHNRFLYTGREYFNEGAFYDYRNRTYLPALGRFLQADPTGFAGDSSNLYRYCGNDPINGRDPSGLQDPRFGFSQDFMNGMRYQGIMQQYGGFMQYQSAVYQGVDLYNAFVPAYNNLSLFASAAFRFNIGGAEVVIGGLEIGEAYKHGLPLSDQTLQGVVDGFEDMGKALEGDGIPGLTPPPAQPMEYPAFPEIHLLMVQLSATGGTGGRPFDYVGSSFSTAFSGAINAIANAAETYGPGTGVVTVTDSSGAHVVWRGTFGGPYGGFAPGTPGYYAHMDSLLAEAGLYLSFMAGGQPGEGTHPVSPDLE
jgi:RHS repeat-associated protein